MASPIIGGFFAFLAGFCVAVVNTVLLRRVLRGKSEGLPAVSVLRQVLNIGTLVLAYCLGPVLPWDRTPLLVGAALGLTIPEILLSLVLAKENDARQSETPSGKGGDDNG